MKPTTCLILNENDKTFCDGRHIICDLRQQTDLKMRGTASPSSDNFFQLFPCLIFFFYKIPAGCTL